MAPFHARAHLGTLVYFLIFFLIGMAFGAVLEMSGFGDSRRLAAQFYLRDMTVLKVMFTGIIVAAVLILLASALQLLDTERVWVNPTYLPPGIVGGLIMGVGFIIGGFCPGTSLVAAATLKIDRHLLRRRGAERRLPVRRAPWAVSKTSSTPASSAATPSPTGSGSPPAWR